ncbi:MAG: DUF11 domain-containing protein, partial [Chloroflexi bacterium]
AALLAGAVDLGAPGPDTTFGNGRLDVLASLQSLGDNDVSVTQTAAPDPVIVGRPLNYTITVANNGPMAASAITLTNSLPSGAVPGPVVSSQGSCGAPVGSAITCTLGSLPQNAAATVTFSITPTTSGITVTNTSVVSATETDFNISNNVSAASTPVLSEASLFNLYLPFIMK